MPTQKFREDVDKAVNEYVVDPIKNTAKRLWENVHGTDAQNAQSKAEMKEQDKANPNSFQAKVNETLGMKKGGKVSSASKRADGCAIRGKTRA